MLAKIKAMVEGESSSCIKDYYINPDYIENAVFSDHPLQLVITMSNGTKYVISEPAWLYSDEYHSAVINVLLAEFENKRGEEREKENRLLSEQEEIYRYGFWNPIDIPEDW